jgi:capsular polysaccharide biosynthesis protein
VELRELVAVIRARFLLVFLCALLAAAAALAVSVILPPSYVASTQLVVGPAFSVANRDPAQLQAASDMAQTYAIALQTRATAQAVIDRLGLHLTVDQLHSRYSVALAANAPVITIAASAGTSDQAAAIASALAQQLIDQTAAASAQDASLAATVTAQITSVDALIATTKSRINQLSAISVRTDAEQAQLDQQIQQAIQLQATLTQLIAASAGSTYNTVTIIDPASAPAGPASPKPVLYSGLALVLGALGGLGLALASAPRNREAPRGTEPTL